MSDTSLPPADRAAAHEPAASRPDEPRRFGVVVPVKPAAVAKSRLAALGDEARRELVVAFALDTVLAALECPLVADVLVVTDDLALATGLRDHGVRAVPDGQSGSLNATLCQGAAELLRVSSGLSPVALCADLPALRPAELGEALRATRDHSVPTFVADADGAGTTMYASPTLASFRPRFGATSSRSHRESGAEELGSVRVESLRRDVDTPEDLRAAMALGVGPRTSWVVTSRRLLA